MTDFKVPKFIMERLEKVAEAFKTDLKPTIGFHVLLTEPGHFEITAYQHPNADRGSINLFHLFEAFDDWREGHLFAGAWMGNCTPLVLAGKMGRLEVMVHIQRDSADDCPPPLLFDLKTKTWTEREPSPDDCTHGDSEENWAKIKSEKSTGENELDPTKKA